MSGRFAPVPPIVGPVSEVTLLALHTAITIGAQVARIAARLWGLPHLEHVAEQAAAHLIARAVETTGHPDPNPRYSDFDPTTLAVVSIRVHRRTDALIIDVWDTDPTPLDTTPPDPHMTAVSALARRWSSYPAPCGGKVVWAELAAPPPHPAASHPSDDTPENRTGTGCACHAA